MDHLYLLWFLVFSLTSCHAGEDRGVVVDFAPSGNFSYIFSKHESEVPRFDWWVKKDGKDHIRYTCSAYELNSNTDHVISQERVTILTTDDVELESFKVTECDKDKLLASIIVSQTREEKHKKGYQIIFKDKDGGCRSRLYQVDITPNNVDSIVAITRDPVTSLTGYLYNKCPIAKPVQGLVSDWYDDGKNHDYVLFDDYKTVIQFGRNKCDRCWILCKVARKDPKNLVTPAQIQASVPENDKVRFVDVLISETPVDRIKVTSCSPFALKTSIKFDYQGKVDDRNTALFINYLKPDGTCYYREYKYDVQLHKDLMFNNIFVKRDDVVLNPGCKSMKARGKMRSFVKKAKRHVGRVTNRLISWKTQEDDE